MYNIKLWLLCFLGVGLASVAQAHINPKMENSPKQNNRVQFRESCDQAVAQTDMSINNVRARLLTGGDVWWDGDDGRYVVPKVEPGKREVSSIFAGAVWLGGVDPAGNLKVAAQTYGRSGGRSDFWPGPLDPVLGTTEQEVCAKWDKFFKITGAEIDAHLRNYESAVQAGIEYDEGSIPKAIRGWPSKGNQFFFDVNGFELPFTDQGLAGFFDRDGDDQFEPDEGDYPVIQIRGCELTQYPDEMVFWIYNDAGNIHAQSQGDPIQMEVQVQAFAYATNDELNDMTFQRYKLINRAIESIDSTFFAMWVDPDLGCYTDDYVGCDTVRSLGYVYNADALDGEASCNDCGGAATYCTEIPILGVDYFRGPLDENGLELGMSSFTYYNNGSIGSTPPGTHDPGNAQEYYNYLSGSWRDGSPFTFGADAYQDGAPIKYAFIDAPDDPNGWSMCSQNTDPNADRRIIQASGPFRLDPGAINELIVGVVWVADQMYPCPSIRELQNADDIAQALFDNCFDITDGPDAPDVDFIELDREIIAVFTNDTITSNNAYEAYMERGLRIPDTAEDSLYRFEGYKLYQLAGPNVTISDLSDPDKARLIYQVDVNNGVGKIFNWKEVEAPGGYLRTPVVQVEGADRGIRHTFRITEDQFAQGDRRLINHKKYYFTAIAYAYNNYEQFDPNTGIGQDQPYLEGRRNIGDGNNPYYTVLPRPITLQNLKSSYGDGAVITRIDGIGVGNNFLRISEETRTAILNGTFDGRITYLPGSGPIDISIFNPLEVKDGRFLITFVDANLSNNKLEEGARWKLIDLTRNIEIFSETTIEKLNEQIMTQYGFSVNIGQTLDAGNVTNPTNGVIGYEEVYKDSTAEAWLSGIPDGFTFPLLPAGIDEVFNFVSTGSGQSDEQLDPRQAYTNIGPGYWVPYTLADWRVRPTGPYISPAWSIAGGTGGNIVRTNNPLSALNNVDIVFTKDKSLWSRCVIVESASPYYKQAGFIPEGDKNFFDLRARPSVGKEDADGDGLPDPDGDGMGMGWFPGYAIDVETGERLNIFFGENSVYNSFRLDSVTTIPLTGADMMFNPTNTQLLAGDFTTLSIYNFIAGAQHFIYVTRQKYDGCAAIRTRLSDATALRKVQALQTITWTCIPLSTQPFLSYAQGLIPNDLTVQLRVDNPYQVMAGTGEYNGYPTYEFSLTGVEAEALQAHQVDPALDKILVVPNPYYGYSAYENSQFSNIVKITNLPAECTVTIYTLDGKFIRQYKRNELGRVPEGNNRAIQRQQINPDLEWDLKNSKGIPVASGVYLIHVDAGAMGERIIKWFGIARQFDPSGL